jgi:RNA polymerase sigma factor (sigma-70 family)
MEVQGRSSLMPRDAVARLGPPRDQTAMAFSSVATPASVEDTCRCLGSAHPTLNEVLARYQDAIYRYAIHLTGNRGDADAVYQETALKAYYEFDRLNGEVNHRAWLYGIATNAFLRNRRQRSKEGSLDEQSADLVFAAAGAARSASCSLVQEVRAAMERLPLQQHRADSAHIPRSLLRRDCGQPGLFRGDRPDECLSGAAHTGEHFRGAIVNAEAMAAATEPGALEQRSGGDSWLT